MQVTDIQAEAASEVLKRRAARQSLLEFIQFVWWKRTPFIPGRHTIAICEAIDDAIEAFFRGESTFLNIAVPFRHGKSDIVSRSLPAYFLGRCIEHEPDVIMSGYGSSLVEGFSREVKKLIRSPEYRVLFPGVNIQAGNDTSAEWAVEGSRGKVTAVGLGGAITGKGGHLIICDDYCKNRAEAESLTYRDRTWESFTNDLLSRRAPVSIVIACATPWHTDDIRGRIKEHMISDLDFPSFREIHFPARDEHGAFLFPERFPESWYRSQYATLGSYSAAALLDCNPVIRGGNIIKVDRIRVHDSLEAWPDTRHVRVWDLASSSKQRTGDDPDYTWGTLGTVTTERDPATGAMLKHLWIRDCVYCREEAPERNRLIVKTAERDGNSVQIRIESHGAYKDALKELQAILKGIRVVSGVRMPGDKLVKASPLEPIFEAGNVHVYRGPWLDLWTRQHSEFTGKDGVSHDDAVDCSALLLNEFSGKGGGLLI